MPNQPDGNYDTTKPWRRPPAWSYLHPNASNQERLVQQALAAVTEPGADLADNVRPPLEQVYLFRPRFGWRNRQLGIEDIINIDSVYTVPDENTDAAPGAQGSPRNSFGSGMS